MLVKQTAWHGSRTVALSTALTPRAYERNGSIERAAAAAETSLDATGRLLALLVEKKLLTLDEAQSVADNTDDLELL